MSVPTRTCIGCRRRRPAVELIRLTVSADRAEPATPRATGRGAYLCPCMECFDAAVKRRAAARAFRRPAILDEIARRRFAEACETRKAVR